MTSETKHAPAGNHRAHDDGGIVGVIPYLVVLVCVVAGLYIAWSQGSAGGKGAVIGGIALLVAALVRLVLPARLVGLLGTRKRVDRRAHARGHRRRPDHRGRGAASVRVTAGRGVSLGGARRVS